MSDLVEVTRCENCLHWEKQLVADYGYCHAAKHGYRSKRWEIYIYRTTPADFFCKNGESKEPESEVEE